MIRGDYGNGEERKRRLGGVGSTGDPTERSGRMASFNPSTRIEPIVLTDGATVVAQFEPAPDTDVSY